MKHKHVYFKGPHVSIDYYDLFYKFVDQMPWHGVKGLIRVEMGK